MPNDMGNLRTTLRSCDCLNTTQILDAWQCNFRHGGICQETNPSDVLLLLYLDLLTVLYHKHVRMVYLM